LSEQKCETLPPRTTLAPIKNYRLPKALKPYAYEINSYILFDSSIEPTTYDGSVEIDFNCEQNTNHIILHKAYLDIKESSIVLNELNNNVQIDILSTSYDIETQIYDLMLSNDLISGNNYSLSMKYKGYLQSNGLGFYKSSYTDQTGNLKWLVASQMEAVAARNAFPCFDEPEMKATFKLTVFHNQNLEAISNMPGEKSLM
jgi:aminopeptidase N